MRIYARLVRSEAVNVYRYRGNIVKRQSKKIKQFIWKIKRLRNNRIKYIIDKSHPLVEELINNIGIKSSKLTKLFSLISETLPIGAITINNSENPECHNYEDTIEDFTAFSIKDKFIEIVKELVSNGKTKKEAIEITLSMEPFNHFPELISFADEVN